MVQMDRKGEPVLLPTLSVRLGNISHSKAGFTLLEMLCVIAILAAIAAVVLPSLPSGTSRARLESYAVATAALLKSDRNAAMRRQIIVETQINARSRFIRSGVSGRVVNLPNDVALEALVTARCNGDAQGSQIRFFPSGMSCGGTLALSRAGVGYQVRINWLTGGVDIVVLKRA
jgi:general secretion pathway protein H